MRTIAPSTWTTGRTWKLEMEVWKTTDDAGQATGDDESHSRAKRKPSNTVTEKRKMRNTRKKRMRHKRAELRQAETDRLRLDLDYERRERHRNELRVRVYKNMSRTYWERWRWELQKRKEAMKEKLVSQQRFKLTQCACPKLQQVDPSMLVDVLGSDSQFIGRGSFGIVKVQQYRGMLVAVKEFLPRSLPDDVMNEARLLAQLCHPYLPYLFGVCATQRPYRIVMQFEGIFDNGIPKAMTLHQELQAAEILGGLDWVLVLAQLMEAVCYLHNDVGVVHNDIKTDNILLSTHSPLSQEVQVILADFGKATKLGDAKRYNLSELEQAQYMRRYNHIAPEVIAGETKQSTSSDMFSVGGVIQHILDAKKLQSFPNRRELQQFAERCRSVHYRRRPHACEALTFLANIPT